MVSLGRGHSSKEIEFRAGTGFKLVSVPGCLVLKKKYFQTSFYSLSSLSCKVVEGISSANVADVSVSLTM